MATGSAVREIDVDTATGQVVRDRVDDRSGSVRGSDDAPGDDHGRDD